MAVLREYSIFPKFGLENGICLKKTAAILGPTLRPGSGKAPFHLISIQFDLIRLNLQRRRWTHLHICRQSRPKWPRPSVSCVSAVTNPQKKVNLPIHSIWNQIGNVGLALNPKRRHFGGRCWLPDCEFRTFSAVYWPFPRNTRMISTRKLATERQRRVVLHWAPSCYWTVHLNCEIQQLINRLIIN